MLFSRALSFFAFAATLGGIALATPAAILKRDNLPAVEQVVTQLKSSADTVVPQLQNLATNGGATDATAGPLVDQLIAAFNNASLSLHTISTGASSAAAVKRQSASPQDIAQITADVISDMTTALSNLVNASGRGNVPNLSNRITTLYSSTATFLTNLNTATPGISGLLGGLLGGILPLLLGLLGGLGGLGGLLSLVLSLLGLLGL